MHNQRVIYLIDGVGVPQYVFKRRALFGEYVGARFEVVEIQERSGRP
jgi:hypothetical protein